MEHMLASGSLRELIEMLRQRKRKTEEATLREG